MLLSYVFRSSVVKYDILSNNRRSKRHAVIECLFFKMPLLPCGLHFRRGVGGALLSGFYRRAKKLTLLSGWGMGHYVVCSRQPTHEHERKSTSKDVIESSQE